ncbi:MAG: acyl-CoA dehydrogenase family protein [Candidatus Binatia bacterium]
MNFGFSDEQEMLRESARKFLHAHCPPSFVREMIDHETGHSADLWQRLAELGWLGLFVPEKLGGMGGSLLDAAVILEETGKSLLPGPFFASVMLGSVALAAGGSSAQKAELLPRVARGSLVLTVALIEAAERYDADGIQLVAKRKGDDFVLSGEKRFVLDAGVADAMLVAARTTPSKRRPEHGITLFLVERGAPGLGVTHLRTADMTRRQAHLSFDRVVVRARQVVGGVDRGWPICARVLECGAAGIAVETVGVAQRALDLAVEYAKQRVQFGKPIGSFQAVKHKCVDMMVAVENARSLAYYAAWAVGGRKNDAAVALAMAKAYTADMGKNVTGDAIQVHGGIGFTWEHDVHLYYRRALANETAFGSAPLHREAVARRLDL